MICKTLKKLSRQLQPYQEVERAINEVHTKRPEEKKVDIRVLVHLISYAEFQFGDRIPGKAYRERENGERTDNWRVEQ